MSETKKIARMIMLALLFLVFTVNTLHAFESFSCGKGIVSVGDYSIKVLSSCGEPISRDVIGYILKNQQRELKLEVWVYGPKDGLYYNLTFEGGILSEIKGIKK